MKTKVFAVVVGLGVLAAVRVSAAVPYFGSVAESPAGQYQFTDPAAATNSQRFCKIRSP